MLSHDAQQSNCRQSICLCIGWAKDQERLKHIHRGQLDFSLKDEICAQHKGKLSLLLEVNIVCVYKFINTRTDFSYGLLQWFNIVLLH